MKYDITNSNELRLRWAKLANNISQSKSKWTQQKFFGSSKKYENVVKMAVFAFFSKTALTILAKMLQNVELIKGNMVL